MQRKEKAASERRRHLGQQVRGFSCNVFQNQRGLPVQIRVLQGAGKRQTEINQCNDYCDFKNDRNTYLIVVKHRQCGSTYRLFKIIKRWYIKLRREKNICKRTFLCTSFSSLKILWITVSVMPRTHRSWGPFFNQKDDNMNPGIITGVLRPSILRKNILCTHILYPSRTHTHARTHARTCTHTHTHTHTHTYSPLIHLPLLWGKV